MRSKKILLIAGLFAVVLIAAIFAWRGKEPAPAQPAATPAPPLPAAVPAAPQADASPPHPDAVAARAPAPRTPELSEKEIMAKISDLGSSDPAQTLRLAREGNRRFRTSPDAPERASHIVRALLNLDRREEAREEALKMEKEYPGSPWTDDVHRHMFVNPPTHPAERGYGKTKELE